MTDTFIVVQEAGPQGPTGGFTSAGTNLSESPVGTINLDATLTGLTAVTTADMTVTDDLQVDDDVTLASGSVVTWGGDTNLYRSGANTLKTDDDYVVAGGLQVTGNATNSDTQAGVGTTTSTSYTATLSGGTACGIAFTAPLSGAVLIINNTTTLNSAANYSMCTIRIKTGAVVGSGTDVLATSDGNATTSQGTSEFRHSTTTFVSGLTPGSSYNVQQLFRVTGGTGTFGSKHLIVQKVI